MSEFYGMYPAPSLQGPVGILSGDGTLTLSQKSPDGAFFQLCHGHTDLYRPVISKEDFKSFQKARHHHLQWATQSGVLKAQPRILFCSSAPA